MGGDDLTVHLSQCDNQLGQIDFSVNISRIIGKDFVCNTVGIQQTHKCVDVCDLDPDILSANPIADLVNGWPKAYKLDYILEQESLNTEIDQALNDYFSKNGGKGGNRPDAKLAEGLYAQFLIDF